MDGREAKAIFDEARDILRDLLDGQRRGAPDSYMRERLELMEALLVYTLNAAIEGGKLPKGAPSGTPSGTTNH